MAIGDIIKYESTFDYELEHPITGAGIGVFFKLRSSSSPEVKAVVRKHLDYSFTQIRKGKNPKGVVAEQQQIERVAASVAGWDWCEQELHKGEGVPEYNFTNVCKALEVDWIFNQIDNQVSDAENFT